MHYDDFRLLQTRMLVCSGYQQEFDWNKGLGRKNSLQEVSSTQPEELLLRQQN
jgi:hypothetical protein